MLSGDVSRYRFGSWTIGMTKDWPNARVVTNEWATTTISGGPPRQAADPLSLVLEMTKAGGAFSCALMGLTYAPGGGPLLLEVPVSAAREPNEQNSFVGPLGRKRYTNGWPPEFTDYTMEGLATGLESEVDFGGTIRLTFAGHHVDTGPKVILASFAPILCQSFLAAINGAQPPNDWTALAPADDGKIYFRPRQ